MRLVYERLLNEAREDRQHSFRQSNSRREALCSEKLPSDIHFEDYWRSRHRRERSASEKASETGAVHIEGESRQSKGRGYGKENPRADGWPPHGRML